MTAEADFPTKEWPRRLQFQTLTFEMGHSQAFNTLWPQVKQSDFVYGTIYHEAPSGLSVGRQKWSEVQIPGRPVNLVVNGNLLSPVSLSHVTWWDLMRFCAIPNFRVMVAGSQCVVSPRGDGACTFHYIYPWLTSWGIHHWKPQKRCAIHLPKPAFPELCSCGGCGIANSPLVLQWEILTLNKRLRAGCGSRIYEDFG